MKSFIYRQLKKPFFGRFMVRWRHPLPEAERSRWQPLRIASATGGTLAALYRQADGPGPPRATLVLAHPMGKEAKGYFLKHGYAELLLQAGYNVLVFDFNGFGESSMGNFRFHEDVLAAGRAAQRVLPAPQLGLLGISLGAEFGVVALASPGQPFGFAVLESGATTLEEFWHRFPAARLALAVLGRLLPRLRREVRMIDRMAEVRGLRSILFIYSRTDAWVPFEMGGRYQARCPVPSELYEVPEGVHAQLMKSPHAEAYRAHLLEYLQRQTAPVAVPG